MKRVVLGFLFVLFFALQGNAAIGSDTTIVQSIPGVYSILISKQETHVAVLDAQRQIKVYTLPNFTLTGTYKVGKNVWLDRAYFNSSCTELYYDSGTGKKLKYFSLNLNTGEISSQVCKSLPKGCGYYSLSTVNWDTPIYRFNTLNYFLQLRDLSAIVYLVGE